MITVPIIVLVLSAILLNEKKINKTKVFGISLQLCGALVLSLYGQISETGNNILLGNFLIFINAASYSYYLILMLTNKYHPWTLSNGCFYLGH